MMEQVEQFCGHRKCQVVCSFSLSGMKGWVGGWARAKLAPYGITKEAIKVNQDMLMRRNPNCNL